MILKHGKENFKFAVIMNKNEIKSVLEFLSNEENVASILPKINKDAQILYDNFYGNVINMYSNVNEQYKNKIAEVILNELTEKQGGHNPAWSEKDKYNLSDIEAMIHTMRGDGRNADRLINWLKDRVQPQPNQEWSEEDERKISLLDALCDDQISKSSSSSTMYREMGELKDWLKSLKGRVQPKQDWSQNDIDMIDWLIRCCEKEHEELCNDKYGHQDIVSDLKRDCRKKWDWLESLKNRVDPQKQWKPSEKQMYNLSKAAHYNCAFFDMEVLKELYDDLRQL